MEELLDLADLEELDLVQQQSFDPNMARKAHSQMDFQRLQSLQLPKNSAQKQWTENYQRSRTDEFEQNQKKHPSTASVKSKQLNASGKKGNKKGHEDTKKVAKSGKHINKFAPKTKNKFR